MGSLLTFLIALLAGTTAARGFELPADSTQCVVGLADDWDSSHAKLSFYEKHGGTWQRLGDAWPARLGKSGLVWGLGMHPLPPAATTKREGDLRAPAGVFHLGDVWGAAASMRKPPLLAYHHVTSRDLWIEDPASPDYNKNVRLDHDPATAWEKKQQMKQDDPAHALQLFIAHNAPPKVVAAAGSSIFFHIWRADGGKPTAGCTTMAEPKLRELIANLDPSRRPVYVLLPKAEYAKYRAAWKLP
ncbi:MAG: L,D-transpeptidase family protein [Verrucomicrobiota bacterium]